MHVFKSISRARACRAWTSVASSLINSHLGLRSSAVGRWSSLARARPGGAGRAGGARAVARGPYLIKWSGAAGSVALLVSIRNQAETRGSRFRTGPRTFNLSSSRGLQLSRTCLVSARPNPVSARAARAGRGGAGSDACAGYLSRRGTQGRSGACGWAGGKRRALRPTKDKLLST